MNVQGTNIPKVVDASGKTLCAKSILRMGPDNVWNAST